MILLHGFLNLCYLTFYSTPFILKLIITFNYLQLK
nr:MAG TPA: hypothetical protein [Caudoviricetes sp.]